MDDTDLAMWGLIVVPVGLVLCFGPALLFWLREELKPSSAEKDKAGPIL